MKALVAVPLFCYSRASRFTLPARSFRASFAHVTAAPPSSFHAPGLNPKTAGLYKLTGTQNEQTKQRAGGARFGARSQWRAKPSCGNR